MIKNRRRPIYKKPTHNLTGHELIALARPTPCKRRNPIQSEILSAPAPQKNYKLHFKKIQPADPHKLHVCSFNGYLVGQDATKENTYFKKLYCGREWCECCGHDESISHQRRIARAFPKIMSLTTVGYLVVTVPDTLRNEFMNRKILTEFKEYWKRKIKRDLGQKTEFKNKDICGLIRYHWAGDDNITFKPHLNILINNSWIDAETLEKWRHELKYWFKQKFNISAHKVPEANIYYQYTRDKGKIYHRLKYITRATLHRFQSPEVKNFFLHEMKNFKNTTVFGKFPPVAALKNDAQKIYNYNICPFTNTPITWDLYTSEIKNVVANRFVTDKGLGIFHAFSCHVVIKYNHKVSALGKQHKAQKLKEERPPGWAIYEIQNSDRYYFHLDRCDYKTLKLILK